MKIPWKLWVALAKQVPGMKVRDAISTIASVYDASRVRQKASDDGQRGWAIVQTSKSGRHWTIGRDRYTQAEAEKLAHNYGIAQPEFKHFIVRAEDAEGRPLPWKVRVNTGFMQWFLIEHDPSKPKS